MEKELLSTKEAICFLGVTAPTFLTIRKHNLFEVKLVGRSKFYFKEQLEQYNEKKLLFESRIKETFLKRLSGNILASDKKESVYHVVLVNDNNGFEGVLCRKNLSVELLEEKMNLTDVSVCLKCLEKLRKHDTSFLELIEKGSVISSDFIEMRNRLYELNRERLICVRKRLNKNWRDNNVEKNKERHKSYRDKNREELLEYRKNYYEQNKEREKQYVKDNNDSIKEKQKLWREKNKEKIAIRMKAYRLARKNKLV